MYGAVIITFSLLVPVPPFPVQTVFVLMKPHYEVSTRLQFLSTCPILQRCSEDNFELVKNMDVIGYMCPKRTKPIFIRKMENSLRVKVSLKYGGLAKV